jgi:hypothetical protein
MVLMSHYGPSNRGRLSEDELDELCAVLTAHDARLIAWIHGHTHKSDFYTWSCGGRSVPVFNVGSPFYRAAENERRLHFAVIRIGNQVLEAVDVSVPIDDPSTFEIPGHRTVNESTAPTNPDGEWGGWAVRVPILAPPAGDR